MKLADWFKQRNPDGTRRLKGEFAKRIKVAGCMVGEYCRGDSWPSREVMERIVRETNGEVTANDFLHLEAAE